MANRISLGLEDLIEDDKKSSIDLEQLAGNSSTAKTDPQLKKALEKESAKLGFPSRQPTKKFSRRRSPYTDQCNLRMRSGMRDIFQELGNRLEMFDQEILESSILALIEKEEFDDLKEEYESIVRAK